MMKRFGAFMLAVCLLLTLTPAALAAPTRDTRRMEITLEAGLETLVELVMGAAVLQNVTGLEVDQVPSQALVEGVLALGLYSLALPYEGEDIWENKASLTEAQIAELYSTVFSAGTYTLPAAPVFPGVAAQNGGLAFDLSSLQENPVVGVQIYSSSFDGSAVTLNCDLFTYYGVSGQSAEGLPEDALTWLCNAQVLLAYEPAKPFSYTLSGFALSETYQDGMLHNWNAVENTEYEYSVTLPGILGLAEDNPAAMEWQTADGSATLIIRAVDKIEGGYEAALDSFRQDFDSLNIIEMPEFSSFSAEGEGVYELYLVPEDISWSYVVTFHFPAERQAEFTLYAEFIRNSLILWGVANG